MGVKRRVKFDVDKLQELSDLLERVQRSGPGGEHMITLRISPSFSWGEIEFMLHWKCENGHLSFKNLDEAIDQAKRIEMWAADRKTRR